jgi:hypothetical protein
MRPLLSKVPTVTTCIPQPSKMPPIGRSVKRNYFTLGEHTRMGAFLHFLLEFMKGLISIWEK